MPWKCRTGALPVMEEVKREARRRKIKLFILPTVEAIAELQEHPAQTNAILHVTCWEKILGRSRLGRQQFREAELVPVRISDMKEALAPGRILRRLDR